jgi:hypothetical protein
MIAWAALAGMLVASAPRVNLYASEDVDPDLLAALARPESVLWLRTRSNVLRKSVSERLRRFPQAYVQLRPPLRADAADALGDAGGWIEDGPDAASAFRLGPRPLALEVHGELTEARVDRISRLRPAILIWTPVPAGPTLDGWARLTQLPGEHAIDLRGLSARFEACEGKPKRTTRFQIDDNPALEAWAHQCGAGTIVRVAPAAPQSELEAILARDPSAELSVDVPDDRAASAARNLLDRAEAAGSALK